ncbi:MAG: hypothetical protein K2M87_05335, partial [Muribaculaceae bacterium]|nr:hypothetical protein [Muribaculaceae bacterium]
MKRFLHILSVLVTLTSITFTLSAQQQETSKQTIIANLRQELTKTKSAKDSIIILYDIFDLSRQREKVSVGNEILKTASHIGDVRTKLDIYRQLTSSYHDDNDFLKLIKAVKKLPDSREKKETLTFLEMKRLSFSSKFTPESERQRAIAKLIADEPQDKKGNDDDATEKLMALYTLVEYLRNEAPGEMLEKYLDKLVKQVNSESFELYALPNTVYSEAANIYSDAGDATRAIEADRKLLEVIDGLDAKYKAQGREFRDYARNRYVVYRRMMRNYKGLKPGDADDLMEKARQLAEIDADVKADLELQPRMKAYYNMATGNYAEAIPYIKRLLDKDTETTSYNGNAVRRQLLEMLVTAAEKTGDDQTRIKALTEYNAMLNEYEDLKASQRYKELQIKYDIADLKEQNSQLELEAKDSKIKSMRRSMILELTAFGIVVVVLVFFLLYWS